MSLNRYPALDRAQKTANAIAAAATASSLSRRPPKTSPAKTSRFLVHWPGRSELQTRAHVDEGRADTARPSDVSGRSEAPDGVGFVVVGLEDGQQFRDGQQIGDPLGESEQLEVATLTADSGIGPDDLAKTCAVDVRDAGQVQDDLLAPLEGQAVNLVLQNFVAFTQRHLPGHVENGDVSCCSFRDLHRPPN